MVLSPISDHEQIGVDFLGEIDERVDRRTDDRLPSMVGMPPACLVASLPQDPARRSARYRTSL